MKSYNFKQCTLLMLDKTFGIEQTESSDVLDDWMNRREKEDVSDFEKMSIERLQKNMRRNIYSWNEQELALNFIGPLISLITFSSKKFNFVFVFSSRAPKILFFFSCAHPKYSFLLFFFVFVFFFLCASKIFNLFCFSFYSRSAGFG